ncbi:conserved hypothetical protein [Culex quinquefasciatus]|uniref:CHK kinase-like domain-containing protein n=1 Tax=Culex quinquefasciatus TaxID=7176 RepID=B0WUL7_CULQU|nr:conserved hypothetical protein [Culex quinquefasciatus]|eukprot:XP_001858967.1 conserved hypothetical protein [Culex quinquefasciatus]
MPGSVSTRKDPTTWLNNEFFEKVLRQVTNDKGLVVEDFFINLHANAGEHYASTIYRAQVSYRSRGKVEPIALVIKLITSKVNQLADDSSFENELNLYKNLLNQMQNLLKKAGVEGAQLAPKLLYASTEPQPVIILEDVTSKKYELHKGLMNLENSKAIATKLARFHAASYCALQDIESKSFGDLSAGLFQTKPNNGTKFMEENFGIFAEELAKWGGFEKYAEKIKGVLPTFLSRGAAIYNQHNNCFAVKVLNHGDFHYNNMLVRFDSDRTSVADVLLIDYQLSFVGSPAIDLFYLLYLVCDRETREKHRQELIYHYHRQLVETLAKVGHIGKVPTLFELNEDMLKCGFLEVVIAVCFIPFLFADYGTALNVFDNSQDAKQYRRQLYNGTEYRKIIEPLLPNFLHKGFLD